MLGNLHVRFGVGVGVQFPGLHHKLHPVMNRKDFLSCYELCFYCWKEGAAHKFFGPDNERDLWEVKKPSNKDTVHLTEKPVELSVKAITLSSRPGENVLELFGGSGSTLIGCEQTGRNCFVIVEDGIPKILTHVCEYGLQPQPEPSPSPNPDPTPKPNPPPNLSIQDWVTQNVPEAGRHQCAALASCYEATANAIENGSILTQAAAFSTIRTATQTKIDVVLCSEFLDALSGKVTTTLAGSTDVKKLGTIFREIAAGLKAVSDMPLGSEEQEVSSPDVLPLDTFTYLQRESRLLTVGADAVKTSAPIFNNEFSFPFLADVS